MEIYAPDRSYPQTDGLSVFLAGTIEMGAGENWQERISQRLHDTNPDVVLFNPRRKTWDSSLEQRADNPVFAEQVNWELDHIEKADVVVFYFQPGTYSPISLLELGNRAQAQSNIQHFDLEIESDNVQKIIVCCPDGFWRKGNVEIVCQRANIPLVDNLDDVCRWISQL